MTEHATTNRPIHGMRIHFYGVQGSGSTSPVAEERRQFLELSNGDLLLKVFEDLQARSGAGGRLACSVEEILGGPLTRKAVLEYRDRFAVPELKVYGGWTTCLRIETSDGYDFVFDCGSGFRQCAKALQAKWGGRPARDLHLFGSHSHLDHTEGFDQAPICFDPRNQIFIYGNRQFLRALDQNLGIFSRRVAAAVKGVQTPIFYGIMPARFTAFELRDFAADPPADPADDDLAHGYHDLAKPIRIGATTIRAFDVFHPAPCLAYRIEHGGKVFVFCTDHELRHGPYDDHPHQLASLAGEQRLIEHAAGADLLYRDGQYLLEEYNGVKGIGTSNPVSRIDWGHSCLEDVVDMARACGVKRTLIGHHDPNRDWAERNWLDETLERTSRGTPNVIEFARAEEVIDL